MKPGDFVKINYVGRIKNTGEIFDLTREDVAKKENIYKPDGNYTPVVLILGSGFVIEGLDEELQKMKVGEKKKVDIPPDKAFGKKKGEMVKIVPESVFKNQDLNATPGAVVTIGNMRGKVLSVDGGRVKIDFNHPLAGKILEYDLEILEKVGKLEDQIRSVVDYFTRISDAGITVKDKEAEITVLKDVDVVRPVKNIIAQTIIRWCAIEKVKWTEVFESSKQEAEEVRAQAEK